MGQTRSNGGIHKVTGVSTIFVASSEEIGSTTTPIPKGAMIYNSTTGELKVSDGVSQPVSLPDHKHPTTYAPLTHTHMFGTNEPWLMSNPRLWLRADLANHPELVTLEGQILTDAEVTTISKVYPGTKLLTNKLTSFGAGGYTNGYVDVMLSNMDSAYNAIDIFNDMPSLYDIQSGLSQWITSSNNLSTAQSVEITFKDGFTYRPNEYWIVPATGTNTSPIARRPTPKSWTLSGVPDDGSEWEVLDEHTDVTEGWESFQPTAFYFDSTKHYTKLKLTITEWNASGHEVELATGISRLVIFGRERDRFYMPNLATPSDEFVWVIPRDNINTGLKHEDVGDCGTTATHLPLPAYRVLADGSYLKKDDYPELYAVIGHKYSTDGSDTPDDHSDNVTISGTDIQITYSAGGDNTTELEYITAGSIGRYTLSWSTDAIPVKWVIEAKQEEDLSYTEITSMDISGEDLSTMTSVDFSVDNDTPYDYTKIRITEWQIASPPSDGIIHISAGVYIHPDNQFQLPSLTSEHGITTYIVARNTADDTSADVITRLQQNVVDLAAALAALQNRVNELDPSIPKG